LRPTCGDYRVLSTNAHGPRVCRAPGIPCALCYFGGIVLQSSGASRRENADAYPVSSLKIESGIADVAAVIARSAATRQSILFRGEIDCFVAALLAMTVGQRGPFCQNAVYPPSITKQSAV